MPEVDKPEILQLVSKLDDFDINIRMDSLRKLKEKGGYPGKSKGYTNMHCHTFYSFNSYGYSPAHVAWNAYKEGLDVTGIIDFDTLDGMEEIFEAGEMLGIKTTANIETRVFIKDYADKELCSPKEPGIAYFMGIGFYKPPSPGTKADAALKKMKSIAQKRNLQVIIKVNEYLSPIELDYEKDAVPLTPKGNVTERHIVTAYVNKVKQYFKNDTGKVINFWSKKLEMDEKSITKIIDNLPVLYDTVRARLIKFGGVGYIKPTPETFPTIEETIAMIRDTDALPAYGWLDGTSAGEKNVKELLQFLLKKGVLIQNTIPDSKNWSNKDDNERAVKIRNFGVLVKTAKELDLPLIAGTEMNKYGQKFVDEFESPELKPYVEDFRKGALLVYGHTQLGKNENKGFNSDWAAKSFPDRAQRNEFFIKKGELR